MTIRDLTFTSWGLIPAPLRGDALRYTALPKVAVTDIAVHHMTGWNPPPDATLEMEIRFLQGIDEYHRSSRGLDGIGYHIVPMASGQVYIVSRLDYYGAHVGYENDHLIGLALPGDYSSQVPSPGHLAAAVEAVRCVYGYLGRVVPTTPHLDWGGTTCPGARWREWVPQLQASAKEDDKMTPEQMQELKEHITSEATRLPGIILGVGPDAYYVGPGFRAYQGKHAVGLHRMGVPVVQFGDPGAPANIDELWAIPSFREMVTESAASMGVAFSTEDLRRIGEAVNDELCRRMQA